MEQKNRVIMKTAIRDNGGSPVFEDREYLLNSDDELAGNGIPMEIAYLKEKIMEHCQHKVERYKKAISDGVQEKITKAGDENVAIVLGKESLMLLLSQKGCEGVRLYFCKNPYGRDSVAAVGVKKTTAGEIKDIGIDDTDKSVSILKAAKWDAAVWNMEVGPPNTIAQLFNPSKDPFVTDLKKVFNIS